MSRKVLLNGKVITLDRKMPKAQAIAIDHGRIVKVGDNSQVKEMIDSGTEVIDLKGRAVIPGFIDSHAHLLDMVGMRLVNLDLIGVDSIPGLLEKVRDRVKASPPGRWIVGSGWDESKMAERRYVTRFDIDPVSPYNPVVLTRIDGHLAIVNTAALEAAAIRSDMPYLDKDNSGELTGILKDQALSYLPDSSSPDVEARREALGLAIKEAHKLGITSVHEIAGGTNVRLYQEALLKGGLPLRVYLMLLIDSTCEGGGIGLGSIHDTGIYTGFGNENLKVGPVKIFVDGSLGARTASLFADYTDEMGNSGLLLHRHEELTELVGKAYRANMQIAIHAIGDRGIDEVIGAYAALPAKGWNMRNRIEHAELITEEQIKRAQELGLILSMQPNFVGQWGYPGGMYETRLGERYRNNNPFRQILDAGVVVAFGSDCMPLGPLYGIHCAVNHPNPECRMTPEEALRCYTISGAYASFEENVKGSIEVGKLADLVVLSESPLEASPDTIKDIRVEITMVGGEVVI